MWPVAGTFLLANRNLIQAYKILTGTSPLSNSGGGEEEDGEEEQSTGAASPEQRYHSNKNSYSQRRSWVLRTC